MKMKTFSLLSLFAICSVLLILPFAVHADGSEIASGTCGENLTWVLTDDGVLTISGEGEMEDYYGDAPWYRRRSLITDVVIGNGVTSIGEYAFLECLSIRSVTIPASVTYIGWGAFYATDGGWFDGFSSLESITVDPGNSVYHSAENCLIETSSKTLLYGCKNSVIPEDGSVEIIEEGAFICSALTSISIPESVTTIRSRAFWSSALESVEFSEGLITIDYESFADTYISSITIPASVTMIDDFAFNASTLESIHVAPDNSVYHSDGNCVIKTEIKALIFGCRNSVIPVDGSVIDIYDFAFVCGTPKFITIPSSVTDIGHWAFMDTPPLHVLYIGTEENALTIDGWESIFDDAIIHYNCTGEEIAMESTEASCENSGVTTYTCTICGESYSKEDAATGHSYVSEITTAPGCESVGVMTYTCHCGDSYVEEIPATGHAYTSVVTAPTCTEDGYTTHTCAICGATYTSDPVEATGHQHEVTVVEATCTAAGSTTYTCHCGDTYTEEIPALGHSFVDGTCTNCGAPESEPGDANGDGKVNARDARLILRYAASLITDDEIDQAAADFNGDGKINARDARALLRAAAGLN